MNKSDHETFYARAAQLGHSREHLEQHGQIATKVVVNDIDELRRLVRNPDPAVATRRQTAIDHRTVGQLWNLSDHVEAFIYGNKELSAKHRNLCAASFPMNVICVSVQDPYTLPPGETAIGPSGPPVVWNYTTINVPNGSWITAKNNNFTLWVTNLVMQYTPGTRRT